MGVYGKEYFEKVHKIENPERKTILAKDLDFLLEKKQNIKRLLDVGCGLGEFLQFCDKRGIATYGMEISQFAISIARKNTLAHLTMIDASRTRWPYPSGFFDAVCAFDVLEHVGDSLFIIREAFRVLVSGGIFLAATPNGDLQKSKLASFLPNDSTHINVRPESFWQRQFKKAGFVEFSAKGCVAFGFPPSPSWRRRFKARGLPIYIGPIFLPLKSICPTLFMWSRK